MKRLLVGRLALVILCCFPFASVAQTVLFKWNFSGIGTFLNQRIPTEVLPENLGYPTTCAYSYCYCVEYNEVTYLQIGDKVGSGGITTPANLGLSGDVVLFFTANPVNDETKVEISRTAGTGTVSTTEIPLAKGWRTYYVLITDVNNDTRIQLVNRIIESTPYRFLVSNIGFMTKPFITISEENDNSSILSEHIGQPVDLKLIRTFKGGIWNTACLPFKSNYAVWHYSNIEGLTESLNPDFRLFQNKIDNSLHFVSTGDISGGTPYLLKIDRDLVNPIFHNVVITTSTPSTVTDDNYSFVGTFGPTALKTDGTNVFLGTDNVLYKPAADSNTLKGIRAYFEIPASSAPARISIDDGDDATGIKTLKHDNLNKVYNLHGQQVSRTAKGLYIINGKKIILK